MSLNHCISRLYGRVRRLNASLLFAIASIWGSRGITECLGRDRMADLVYDGQVAFRRLRRLAADEALGFMLEGAIGNFQGRFGRDGNR